MANRNRAKAGGGINSNKVVQKPVKVGQRAEAINERGVSQIGSNLGNKATDKPGILKGGVEPFRGAPRPPGSPGGVELGNSVAARTVCGPGGSREVSKSGAQGQHGPVAGTPKPQGRDILSGYGADIPGRR
jgi:hypothetical protein